MNTNKPTPVNQWKTNARQHTDEGSTAASECARQYL